MQPRVAERVTRRWTPSESDAVYQLENGSMMDQKTFHTLYLKTPEGFKAELIGGIVYVMSSPVSFSYHGQPHARLVHWLSTYSDDTPGTGVGDNATNILGNESEPQPDAFVVIDPECGGQTTLDDKGYVRGGPELVAEVANSSSSIDLNAKKADYERAGVKEYLVILVQDETIRWFVRRENGFVEHTAGAGGVIRSAVLPGLWLRPGAFFEPQTRKLFATLRRGIASPEHAAFVAELAARRKKKPRPAGKKPRKSK